MYTQQITWTSSASSFSMRRLLTVAVLACLGTPQPAASETNDAELAKVLADWRSRQETVKSLSVTWDEEVIWGKGHLSDRRRDRTRVIPPADTGFTTRNNRLRLRESLVRIELTIAGWDNETGAVKQAPSIEVFAAAGRTTYLSYPTIGTHPMGLIRTQKRFESGGIPAVRAILMSVRPMEPTLSSYKSDRLEFTGRSILIGGRRCNEIIEHTPGESPGRPITSLWVDPGLNNVITRYTYARPDGKLTFQLDVAYTKSTAGVWLPATWNSRNPRPDGSISVSYRGRCVVESVNSEVADDEFQLSFPSGTKVYDYSASAEASNNPVQYITRDDGSKRFVRSGEMNRTYEELLNSPDPERGTGSRRKWIEFTVLFLGLSVSSAFGLRLLRRLRLKSVT